MSDKLVLFSGDLFSPSNISQHFKGENMIEVFKRLCVDVSCLGNHDTDFGLERCTELISKTKSPWLMANLSMEDGSSICGLPRYHVLEYQGVKVGLFGVCEEEWLGLFCQTVTEELIYEDFVQAAKQMSKVLKEEHACEYIIALTHMRLPNDRILAEQCQGEVDLVLGGHDHGQTCELIGDVTLIKSGTDFEEFSDITVRMDTKEVVRERVVITSKFKPDQQMAKHVKKYTEILNKRLDQNCAYTDVELEGRFECSRAMETNLGNWLADVI